MNATQFSRFPVQPPDPPSSEKRQTRRSSKVADRTNIKTKTPRIEIALETTLKLVVNLLLCGIAGSALIQLLPYLVSGREQLQDLETELARTETRVDQLRDKFGMYFDPQQTKTIMQEESNLTDPAQLRIIWVEPEETNEQP
ncbi:MAG: hypothetical protein SWY16_24975 [Cyanobacteriota bacterium]|nr:hypothetical protein [Cyanobacteriota bacterium]